ncbi:MAG: NAD(P)/FAD-dependent oxidoreductase [Pseudomonadales bacterium]|nr:NAD(P)/FAD-dependent oxidoreductase [Pseudomonadales bacterium]
MEHVDVIIVGAGLSGIGAACHLKRECPGRSFTILEARDAIGGTWDLFRYPGVRSDSDMHTLGYDFKPWTDAKAIADGPAILEYVRETARENGLMQRIRYGHRVRSARWDSDEARWTVTVDRVGHGRVEIVGNFLYLCSGYYDYEGGHTPGFDGQENFGGEIVHPQFWPETLDHAGKRVVIIGSGATAMTLAPAMAETGARVTMVQRSPTYVISRPDMDKVANSLRKWLPDRLAYAITRWKNVALQGMFYRQTRVRPAKVRSQLLGLVRRHLGPDYDVATHFTPRYDPWDQRLCLIPNADLFRAIKSGALEVVTDQIDRFTEHGIKLASGRELPADVVVTATGLKLAVMGGVTFTVDGKRVNFPDTTVYKGMMYSDVPNLVQTFGYINASWTLRADLTARYVCRLLNRMAERGVRQCTPRLREEDREMPRRPWIDDFSSGYMQRSMHLFPRQGDRHPWRHAQDYAVDKKLTRAPIEDGVLVLDNRTGARQARQRVA